MRFKPVAHIFGWLLLAMALSMVVPLAFAVFNGEQRELVSFAIMIVAATFTGGGFVLALQGPEKLEPHRHGIMLLGAAWLLLPVFAAAPIQASQSFASPVSAYFEAASALTTTGATVYTDLSNVPSAIIVWRAQLQWLGGFVTILGVAILTLSAGEGSETARVETGHRAHGRKWLPRATFAVILPLYLGLTLACFLGLVATEIPAFDAFCLALSGVSTGGFMPREGSFVLYGSPGAAVVLSLAMFAGAVSLVWLRALLSLDWQHARQDNEPLWIAAAIVVLGAFITLHILGADPGSDLSAVVRAASLGLAAAASFVTTSGFGIAPSAHDALPYVLALAICFIGGGRYSTAGGLKFYRAVAMTRQCWRELHNLVYPHGTFVSLEENENEPEVYAMGAIWAGFAVAVIATAVLALVLSAEGLELTAAVLASVSAIANVGPAYTLITTPELTNAPTYVEMSALAKIALTFGMVFGRLEVLALLTFLNVAYWRS